MNGVIVLNKPADFTSFDAVAVVRGLTREKKTGHTGTLDPMATGVLPLLLGKAAKAAELLPDTDKEYLAEFRFGEATDTGDVTGKVTSTDDTTISREQLEKAASGFIGDIMQTPPMYSAVSVGGKRLYELARKGVEVERQPRPVHIGYIEIVSYDETTRTGAMTVSCSKGTYIRVLIEDIAKAAGTCGVMTALKRTRACGFTLDDAVTLDELKALAEKNGIDTVLRPVDSLFEEYPPINVSPAQGERFKNGGGFDMNRVRMPRIAVNDGDILRVYCGESFLGLVKAHPEQGELRFLKLFAE